MRSLAFLLLLAATASAQVREQVTVELIEVPTYVMAADGTAVAGLPKSAFRLLVNGKEQPIEYFDELHYPARSSSQAAVEKRPLRERRLYLFLFDFHFSVPGRLARAKRAAQSLVARSTEGVDSFSVATYGSTQGVQFVTPFLSDRVAILRAIDTLNVSAINDPLGLSISETEHAQWKAEEGQSDNGFTPGGRDQADAEMADGIRGGTANQEMQGEPELQKTDAVMANFADLAARLKMLEGQKHVVLLSDGIKAFDIKDPRRMRMLNDMFAAFRDSNVFLDAIDISGLRHGVFENPSPVPGRFYDSTNWNVDMLTNGTGGVFIHHENDLSAGLARLSRAHETVYLLGFRRTGNRAGTIDVRVKGAPHGSRVSFRQGYGPAKAQTSVDPLQLADILINDLPQSGVDVDLKMTDGGSLALSVPYKQAASQVTENDSYVTAFIYVFAEDGAAVLTAERRIDVDEGPLRLELPLELGEGRYVAKAVVQVGNAASLGFAKTSFIVSAKP
jgi:VWFA-related protein